MSKIGVYVFTWLTIVLAGAITMVILNPQNKSAQNKPVKIMELTVSGGFWGADEKYEYYSNGTVFFKDLLGRWESNSVLIPSSILDELSSRIGLLLEKYPNGLELKPTGGADYFTYNLTVYHKGDIIDFYWTDVSEEPPKELVYLHSLLREINGFASNRQDVIFYLKTDRFAVRRGETLRVMAIAVNLGGKDFQYRSPTPCTPDFKTCVKTPNGSRIELFPIGYDSGKTCIQVVQERVLKAGNMTQSEYEYTVNEEGIYVIEAYFPYAEWEETRHRSSLEIMVS
jgi:hypothetical protein